MCNFRLPNMRAIGLLSIVIQSELAIKFLENSMPEEIESFYISGDTFSRPKLSEYLPFILKNSLRITNELWIRLFTVTKSDIEMVLNEFPHVKIIGFYDCSFCEITSDLIINSEVDYSIEKLSFEETLDSSLSSISFSHIISGISRTSLKSSLKKLNITRLNYVEDKLKYYLVKHGMNEVSILLDSYWYFYNL